jgi:hypothetical protein
MKSIVFSQCVQALNCNVFFVELDRVLDHVRIAAYAGILQELNQFYNGKRALKVAKAAESNIALAAQVRVLYRNARITINYRLKKI